MFTGIVTDIGEVLAIEERAAGLRRLAIGCRYDPAPLALGASIACAGVCMTAVAVAGPGDRPWFAVDAAAETLAVTTVGRWTKGGPVNLERSLKIGDELGGHLVSGHVDGIAVVMAREDLPDMARLAFRVPSALTRFIAPKGSVALAGVSRTVNAVEADTCSVLLIPHTLQVTTFAGLRADDGVNIEIDMMARY